VNLKEIVKIEKQFRDATRPTLSKWSQKGSIHFVTNGHFLLYGQGIKVAFEEAGRCPLTDGIPPADDLINKVTQEINQYVHSFDIPCFDFDTKKNITGLFTDSLHAIRSEKFSTPITEKDENLIGFNIKYLQLLEKIGFTKLLWKDNKSAAYANIEGCLEAILMPIRL